MGETVLCQILFCIKGSLINNVGTLTMKGHLNVEMCYNLLFG